MAEATESSIQALQTAITVENVGLETYLRFAHQTKDTTGKNMFIRLAMDELEHQRYLEKQLRKLTHGQQWAAVDIPLSEIERVLPNIQEKDKRIRGESGIAEMEALNTALDMERKAAAFFREQADAIDDPHAREMFIRLAEWEDAHYDLIQAEHDAITGTGFWFGIPEFQMDGNF